MFDSVSLMVRSHLHPASIYLNVTARLASADLSGSDFSVVLSRHQGIKTLRGYLTAGNKH